ncbi:HSP20-like chaperone [Leucosporidium creatinivorum]|uniref:HSP20-like chaperone n=1 Tax=Leucosporidium creatinivorum TaxID=106004 RepID=A0A1Y2F769_9BASI|nr:HSP20-like chaperone [Leucosporidium creatinivorum]
MPPPAYFAHPSHPLHPSATHADPPGFMPQFHPLDALVHAFSLSDEGGRGNPIYRPTVDVVETEDKQFVFVELPGMHKGDVEITLADNVLTITGRLHRPDPYKTPSMSLRWHERRFGLFERSVLVAHGLLEEDVKAKMDHGVLEIELPKKGRDERQRPKIQVA